MFIDVIPSEHSIGIHPLTYSVPEGLESEIIPGCIVEIPMRNTTEYGIVVGYRQSAPDNMEIRDITQGVTSMEVLAPYQIALILEIASKYLIPIHRVLGFFLTKNTLKRLEKKNFEQLMTTPIAGKQDEKQWKITILKDTIITGDILRQYLQPGTVIVCPDDLMLYRLQDDLSEDDTMLYLPSESTDTKKAQSWIDIHSKKYDIIVWNRKILYYNLSAYTRIIYLEDAFGREYFHYPICIEYVDILRMIDAQRFFELEILTSTPRLTTLSTFQHFHRGHLSSHYE